MIQLLARFPVFSTAILLLCSNIFMTIAWYGHLKFPRLSLAAAIFAAWGVALLEYCFQVPANRIGYHALTLFQLKVMQEVITLSVFVAFAFLIFGQVPKWNYGASVLNHKWRYIRPALRVPSSALRGRCCSSLAKRCFCRSSRLARERR